MRKLFLVRFVSICIILTILGYLGLELYQMDIKATFLNRELDKEIYMQQSKDFMVKSWEWKVCKLKWSIYGLKQPSR